MSRPTFQFSNAMDSRHRCNHNRNPTTSTIVNAIATGVSDMELPKCVQEFSVGVRSETNHLLTLRSSLISQPFSKTLVRSSPQPTSSA